MPIIIPINEMMCESLHHSEALCESIGLLFEAIDNGLPFCNVAFVVFGAEFGSVCDAHYVDLAHDFGVEESCSGGTCSIKRLIVLHLHMHILGTTGRSECGTSNWRCDD